MKKEYTAPKAEKIEFNYQEVVAASNGNSTNYDEPSTTGPKNGKNNPGCYKSNASAERGCEQR